MKRRTGPSRSVVKKIKARDNERCVCCGSTSDLTMGHRKNRGMGGSSDWAINNPSNLLTQCWRCNALSESDADFRALAVERGWKVLRHKDARLVRCWVLFRGPVFLLDDFSVSYNPGVARAAAGEAAS